MELDRTYTYFEEKKRKMGQTKLNFGRLQVKVEKARKKAQGNSFYLLLIHHPQDLVRYTRTDSVKLFPSHEGHKTDVIMYNV